MNTHIEPLDHIVSRFNRSFHFVTKTTEPTLDATSICALENPQQIYQYSGEDFFYLP